MFLARQPIVDRFKNVVGYELLYRRGATSSAGDMSLADEALSLASALVEIGLNELVGKGRGFINVSEDLILSKSLDSFPSHRVVLEVLEHVNPTPEVQAELKRLRGLGYTLALDDFLWNEKTVPLLPLVHMVKVDITQIPDCEMRGLVKELREFPIKLLAERVETFAEFDYYDSMGYDYFQGYFFAKPQIVSGRALTVNHLALIRLLTRLNADDLSMDELEGIIASEVQLSVRLLKFIKSAYLGLPNTVDSIRKAVMFVGFKTLAAIATLLMMSQFSHKPNELVFMAMVRAKMAETLGQRIGDPDPEPYFTTGMLSLLDAMMDMPMAVLLDQMPLSERINVALLDAESTEPLARVLRVIRGYEAGDFDLAEHEGIDLNDINLAYRRAVVWAGQTRMALAA